MSLASCNNILDIGLVLFNAINTSDCNLGHFTRYISSVSASFRIDDRSTIRDILPIPLPSMPEVYRWLGSVFNRKFGRGLKLKMAKHAAKEVWTWLVVCALYFEYMGRSHINDNSLCPKLSIL